MTVEVDFGEGEDLGMEGEGNLVILTVSSFSGFSDFLRSSEIGSISTIPCNTKEISNMGRNTICAGVDKFFSNSDDFIKESTVKSSKDLITIEFHCDTSESRDAAKKTRLSIIAFVGAGFTII
ncbi:hypothetical protein [Coleofasciculus sp. G2-EDA-02]|uniref:hypothetical protein n=1 Tax=Coleofasciculus sp. G2-EDA-02 TaxID=3069529 RepID=UPI0033037569